MVIKCGICKKEFYGKPSHVAKGNCKYCSKNCFDIWQRANKKLGVKSQRWNSVKRICKVCSKEFYRCPAKIALGRGIYCSKKCYIKAMPTIFTGRVQSEPAKLKLREKRLGSLNPAYIDGRSFETRLYKKYGDNWNQSIRKKVFEKFGRVCSICGETDKVLHVHHIDKNTHNHALDNLIPVCITHHKPLHKKSI